MEACGFVASVRLVEQAIEAGQTFVRILRSEVDAVIVVPQRAQLLVDIAVGRVGGIEAGQHIWVILVAEVSDKRFISCIIKSATSTKLSLSKGGGGWRKTFKIFLTKF